MFLFGASCVLGEKRLTIRAKHDEREGVAKYPFHNASYNLEHTAEEVEYTTAYMRINSPRPIVFFFSYMVAAPPPPAPRHPINEHASGLAAKRKPMIILDHNC